MPEVLHVYTRTTQRLESRPHVVAVHLVPMPGIRPTMKEVITWAAFRCDNQLHSSRRPRV